MPSLRKDLRSQLEKTVLRARELAEQGALEALSTLGVDQAKPFDHLTPDQRKLRNQLRAVGRQSGDALAPSGQQSLSHLTAVVGYEHWHRMLFARFLAENGLLLEPDHQVAVSLADVEELAREAKTDPWELAGRYAQQMLPAVFRADDPVLALPLARETRTQLEKLVADLPSEIFLASDSLGWTYQFWQTQRKKDVNESGVKIGADEISPVTQLFTEDYMVDFLLDNTLGAWWAGRVATVSNSKFQISNCATEEDARKVCALPGCDWNYLRFIKGEDGHWTPAAGTFDGWPTSAAELKCLDPCMGSGHFVVAMFERLVALRMAEESLNERDSAAAVIRDNLFGLELDPRCTQIGAFNLALAAWRRVGHCALPAMNLACSGLAPNTREADWLALAGDNQKLRAGMERLYRLFQKAAVLGSLINPRAGGGDLLEAGFQELQPLLEKALAQEAKGEKRDDLSAEASAKAEMAVTARGLAKAAEILAGQFTLVATNVPYLGRLKQEGVLMEYCERIYPEAKADLATCFLERCIEFCRASCTAALVTPHIWLFLGTYKGLRKTLLTSSQFNAIARLGPGAFETISGEVVNAALVQITKLTPPINQVIASIDVSLSGSIGEKARNLQMYELRRLIQRNQLSNPDSCIQTEERTNDLPLLLNYADSLQGAHTFDISRFRLTFWELNSCLPLWNLHSSSPTGSAHYSGCHYVSYKRDENNAFGLVIKEIESNPSETRSVAWRAGNRAWGKWGVACAWMGNLPVSLYIGQVFDNSAAVILPNNSENLLPIYCFCSSPQFLKEVRKINQKTQVANTTLVKVPFDLAHWQKVAAEKYPHGLPKPFSSDPTQWLFNGHPAGADQPLQVAVARLLGYQWPRQTGSSFPDCPKLSTDGLETLADDDGIVCLSPVRGERSAADRLRLLLSTALGDYDEHNLINQSGGNSSSLEDWLRNEMFEQHCKLFHHRPFIWHIWDGLSDGFHVLINYHQLAAPGGAGRKLLETLTFSYLGDWILRQQDGMKRNEAGAEDRLIAAQALQTQLKAILAGEPPYDLFIRWKPLHQQPLGWEPDINDGVRMNIRPFLLAKDVKKKGAGILRWKPNVKWTKDRGTEPHRAKADFPWFWSWDEESEDFTGGKEFNGNRWNACHYTPATKRAAREQQTSVK